jgi:ABC-2 type transport system permease protein
VSWWRPVGFVAQREIIERTRLRSFRLVVALLAALGVGAVFALPSLAPSGTTRYDLGLVGEAPAGFTQALAANAAGADTVVRLRQLPSVEAARAAVRAEDSDAALIEAGTRLLVLDEPPETLIALVGQTLAGLQVRSVILRLGGSEDDADALLRGAPLSIEAVAPKAREQEAAENLALIGAYALVMALLAFGSMIASGVAEEKGSYVSSVLLAIVRPSQLLAGKIIGIGTVALAELLAIAAPPLVAALAIGSVDAPEATAGAIGGVLLWFVLGYALYSTIYAGLGALVSRQEDVAATILPVTVLVSVSLFISIEASRDPDSQLARIASFVPPFSPPVMLIRSVAGNPAPWEAPLAGALTIVAALGFVVLGAHVYRRALVRVGPRLKLREIFR